MRSDMPAEEAEKQPVHRCNQWQPEDQAAPCQIMPMITGWTSSSNHQYSGASRTTIPPRNLRKLASPKPR